MAVTVPLWLILTLTALFLSVVLCAFAVLRRDSPSTRRVSSRPPPQPTPISLADFEMLRTEVTSLSLGLEALRKQVKKLAGYNAVTEFRAREANAPPPIGTPKAELRRHYGINGKSPREVAELAASTNMQQE